MRSTARSSRLAAVSIAALALALPGLLQTPAQAQAEAQPQPRAQPPAPVAARQFDQVTLITGDRVTLSGGPKPQVSVEPGPGRKGIRFTTRSVQGQITVFPSDVGKYIASGRLDSQLFDVTELLKNGYGDASSESIPVIVISAGNAKQQLGMSGATVTRRLPVVNGTALRIDKAQTGRFLADVTANRSAAGVEKVWLDSKRKVSLDQSVPQIGAPAAWAAGYTGKGVPVAVLDSGIDTSHPDLATQVMLAKNFTDDADGDHNGHGTHVASTIAGTAAASAGKYRGVAPNAKLYDGKVCDGDGSCSTSSILAGMEWAATEVKAKVVNLSISGTDLPGTDPLEAAVDRLSAATGTLFVVAAGNEGPGAATVGSPGSADAALTVGAVDKQDKPAEFSSRGPRVGDGGLKPDVTAPGVGIVAAKAKDAHIGTPVGDRYLQLDGTSMATPHVAGAAALLAQEHPDWNAGQLKGALMTSAKAAVGQSPFEQGAGRIDVAKAIKQNVVTEPSSLSFGVVQFPHDDDEPVTKTLTYRNSGDQPVTLALAATLNAPNGQAAPTGSVRLSAQSVTVPAGGTAAVQVTTNTRHDGPNGAYTGHVTATAADVVVTSGIAVEKEDEHYNFTLRAIGPDGKPSVLEAGSVHNLATGDSKGFFDAPDGTTYRLPKGEYVVDTFQFIPNPVDPEALGTSYTLVQPRLLLTGDTTTVFDARVAKKVSVTATKPGAAMVSATVGFVRRLPSDGGELTLISGHPSLEKVYTGQIGQSVEPDLMTGYITSEWADPGADKSFRNTPYVYGQFDVTAGGFATGLRRVLRDNEMAVVDQQINAAGGRSVTFAPYGTAKGMIWRFGGRIEYDQARSIRLVLDAEPALWDVTLEEMDTDDPSAPGITYLSSPARGYRAGASYRQRINAAAFTTGVGLARRERDLIVLSPSNLMDADGNKGYTGYDEGSARLLRDGKEIAVGSPQEIVAESLSPEKATYVLETSQTRASVATFSTRIDRRWTFTSAATAAAEQLPMLGIRYRPKVDIHNVADRTPVTVLPMALDVQYGGTLPGIQSVEIQVSGDEGKTWVKARVQRTGRGTYRAAFATPVGASVSLKARIVDAAGNVTEDSTIGAYPLG
ncbi:S8 family serine peptidase [Kribbella sp. NBC_01505]|uniref:S8 family peptidase n=1 Tax=Kribbella sp. NBC_01505 TaxID=2903580 RepID=UPI00386C8629